MKFRFTLVFVAALAMNMGAQAQNAPQASASATPAATPNTAQRELAAKLVSLQRGPEMERMSFQLTSSAIQPLINKWAPKLDTLPKASQEKARDAMNAELKTLGESTRKLIEAQMDKSGDAVLLNAYIERFTEEEMKQLVATFEAPIFKKYQALAPELGNIWVKDVIENSREAVLEKGKAFDTAAEKIIGEKAAAPAKASTPAKTASTPKK